MAKQKNNKKTSLVKYTITSLKESQEGGLGVQGHPQLQNHCRLGQVGLQNTWGIGVGVIQPLPELVVAKICNSST